MFEIISKINIASLILKNLSLLFEHKKYRQEIIGKKSPVHLAIDT